MRIFMEKKIDQRVKLTQKLLKGALVLLLKEQHISKISVRAICDVADINRSTFYAHYSDSYDLLSKIEREALDNLNRYLDKQDFDNTKPLSGRILAKILDYLKDDTELFMVLLSENCDFTFQKDILEEILKLSQIVSSNTNLSNDERLRHYSMVFTISGCVSIIQNWLQDGTIESTAELSEFIIRTVYYGISSS